MAKIDAQYRANNIFLERAKGNESKDSANFKTSYVKCGAPFFKDALGCPAPFNDDYKYRKTVRKEFFPFDLPLTNSRWSTKDKVALVNGVKGQMIDYIKSQQSRKLCESSRKTRGKLQKLKFISHSQDLNQSSMVEIYETIQKDFDDFTINWNLVSFNDLHSAHSVSECMGMWISYLRPDINRDPFTEDENNLMADAVMSVDFNSWEEIASQLNNRSSLQSFVQFQVAFTRLCPSHVRWTAEEDKKLMEAVEKYSVSGVINWGKIGQAIPMRNKMQCYNRYLVIARASNYQKRGVFGRDEDRAILDFVSKFGEEKINQMPKNLLPGRSLIQIKIHYNVALKHKGTVHPWKREEDRTLMEFVGEHGTNSWHKIADILTTHNRLSCRTRFLTITKFLAKNPKASLDDVPSRLKKVTAVQRAKDGASEDENKNESGRLRNGSFGSLSFQTYKEKNPKMFEMMRTTFNYDLGARELLVDNTKLLVLKKLLKADDTDVIDRRPYLFTRNQLHALQAMTKFSLDEKLSSEMKFATTHAQFLLPPSYNTAVGLRAIAIKADEPLGDETLPAMEIPEKPSKEYREELENFQKLFFSLFYWSAMLTKLDQRELYEIRFLKGTNVSLTVHQIFKGFHKRKSSNVINFTSSQPMPAKKAKTSDR